MTKTAVTKTFEWLAVGLLVGLLFVGIVGLMLLEDINTTLRLMDVACS